MALTGLHSNWLTGSYAGDREYILRSTENNELFRGVNVSINLRDHFDGNNSIALTGTTAINGTGNSGANVLTGGAGNDTYVVGTGDTVTEQASAGTDTVQSASTWTLGSNLENLTLTGTTAINGTGNTLDNVLTGGAGNDTYVVGTGDSVVENAGAGTDTVQSAITWTLGTNLENLMLIGTVAINGTGNASNNTLAGNSGNNVLTGLGGNDI